MSVLTLKDQAIRALDGMAEIISADLLIRGHYSVKMSELRKNLRVTQVPHGVCGGYKFCAVGSLWVGGGIAVEENADGSYILPGADEAGSRDLFLTRMGRPDMILALRALNQAARQFGEVLQRDGVLENGINPVYSDPIEGLFEGTNDADLTDDDLEVVVRQAQHLIETDQVDSTDLV